MLPSLCFRNIPFQPRATSPKAQTKLWTAVWQVGASSLARLARAAWPALQSCFKGITVTTQRNTSQTETQAFKTPVWRPDCPCRSSPAGLRFSGSLFLGVVPKESSLNLTIIKTPYSDYVWYGRAYNALLYAGDLREIDDPPSYSRTAAAHNHQKPWALR